MIVYWPLRISLAETWRAAGEIEPRVGIHRRIENSRSAANHGLVVPPAGRPGKAEAAATSCVVGEHQVLAQNLLRMKGK